MVGTSNQSVPESWPLNQPDIDPYCQTTLFMYLTESPSISIGTAALGTMGISVGFPWEVPPLLGWLVYGKSIYKWMIFLGVAR
jgi:hypothetical protein